MYPEGFSDRVDTVVKKLGGIGKASAIINVSSPTIGRWQDGTSDAKLSNVIALAKAGDVSLDWLMYGIDSQAPTDSANDEYDYIPFCDIQASAGLGLFTDGAVQPNKHLAFRKNWIQKKGLQANQLIALSTKGDSMQPTIQDGAVIIIDTTQTDVADGKLYVVRIDETLYVKRIQLIPQGMKLISDNKTMYDPIDIKWADWTEDQLQICGQLIHTSHDL